MNEIQVVIAFIQSIVVGGLIGGALVTAFVQFLKSNFIPLQFANKFPRITTAITAVLAAVALTYTQCQSGAQACVELVRTPVGIIAGAIAIFIVSVLIYNNVLRDKTQS